MRVGWFWFRPGAYSVRTCLGIVVTAISAAGCAPAPDQVQHTVDDYLKDRTLRQQELTRCLNDPGSLGKTADCANATAAERTAGVGSLRDLSPLELPPKK